MKYYTIPEMIEAFDELNRAACKRLYDENIELFKKAMGSTHNHQAWDGGYIDHITEAMNVCVLLYPIYNVRKLNFTLADALLVIFLHDLEKPWKKKLLEAYGRPVRDGDFLYVSKHHRKIFRLQKIQEYGIILNEQQQNALNYVESENDDYSNKKRVMNELAAFCHIADVSSARIWYDHGKEKKW